MDITEDMTEALTQPPSSGARLRVRVKDGANEGEALTVRAACTVGSSAHCDLVLEDPTVSRLHLRLEPADQGGLRVVDEQSRNGTYANGVRIHEAELHAGDELRLGRTTLAVEAQLGRHSEPPRERLASFGGFVGQSDAVQPMYRVLERACRSDVTVLFEGESGVGKEVLAEAVHDRSPRAEGPFVVVDCGALNENLVESELFGHARGAFTGATADREGAFERADGGTIFLDEVGELSLGAQLRLLRAIDTGEVRRVGEVTVRRPDFRVVAATNRNLEREVEEGRFRLDLFHRIAVVLVRVPPLRARRSDVPRIARRLLSNLGADPDTLLTQERMDKLSSRPWRGNVRELRNTLESLVAIGDLQIAAAAAEQPEQALLEIAQSGAPYRAARDHALALFNRAYAEHMKASHPTVTAAAQASGLGRRHFYRLLGVE